MKARLTEIGRYLSILGLAMLLAGGCTRPSEPSRPDTAAAADVTAGEDTPSTRPDAGASDGGDTATTPQPDTNASEDTSGNDDEGAFGDVASNGRYETFTFDGDSQALNARLTNGFNLCEVYASEGTSPPDDARVLRVTVGSTETGTYDVSDEIFFESKPGAAHVFFVVRYPNGAATFPVSDGQVEILDAPDSDDEIRLRVDVELPEPLRGYRSCSSSCQCKSLSGETSDCTLEEGTEATQCCTDRTNPTSTVGFERTFRATHCGAFPENR